MNATETDHVFVMGVTDVDLAEVCIGCVNDEGIWIRPKTLTQDDWRPEGSWIRCARRTKLSFRRPADAPRWPYEDREWARDIRVSQDPPLDHVAWHQFIAAHLDTSANAIFVAERTLGLVKATVLGITGYRGLGHTINYRLRFRDDTGAEHSFMLTEKRLKAWLESHYLHAGTLDRSRVETFVHGLREIDCYLCITLSSESPSGYPGPVHDCYPLVGGVHTFPPYEDLNSQSAA